MSQHKQQTGEKGKFPVDGVEDDIPTGLPFELKPKLDKIFAEVEEKLPNIDFDLSDVDSDGEDVTPLTFNHPMKTLEEDKDLDTSQGSESMLELPELSSNKDNSAFEFYDNDLAFALQRSGVSLTPPTVSSWADVPTSKGVDKNKQDASVSTWGDIPSSPRDKNSELGDSERVENKLDKNVKNVSFDNNTVDNREADSEGLSLNGLDDKGIRRQLSREEKRNKDREMATSLISPRAPVLSISALENIDIDALLQNVESERRSTAPAPRQAWGEPAATKNTGKPQTGGLTLIQKLAQLTMSQYGADLGDIDPSTGARRKNTENFNNVDNSNNNRSKTEGPNVEESPIGVKVTDVMVKALEEEEKWAIKVEPPQTAPKKQIASCGTSTSNTSEPLRVITPRVPPKTASPLPQSRPANSITDVLKGNKEPTVFIDLRNFEQVRQEQQMNIERVQQVLGIQSEKKPVYVDSDSEEEEDPEDWRQQRRQFKQHNFNNARTNKQTYTNTDKPPLHRPPPRVINMSGMASRNEPRPPTEGGVTSPSPAQTHPSQQRSQQEIDRDRQAETIRKLREQHESERQAKLRLQKRLEALRPTASISGRQDPAEATPTVFDLEASYESAPRNLPPVMSQDTDCVLLTIHLSSNGEIVLHRGSGNKSVDTGCGLSASYTTLLTWLLALVPQDFTFLKGVADGPMVPWMLPFYVVGLQQGLLDNQLCLMVAVTPVEQFDAKSVPTKAKKNKKSESSVGGAFQQHLQKYLSVNSLHSVCPWLQNLVSMEVAPGHEDGTPGYVYSPPLPNITTKPLSTFIHVHPDPQAAAKVFNTSVGFFWQTVDSDETRSDQDLHDNGVNFDTQNTLSLIYKKIYQDPSSVMGIFNRVLQLGFDLSAIRLVYPSPEQMNVPKADNASVMPEIDILNNVGAVLALCIRGTSARSVWLDAVGPSDPVLARRTDPNSLCALYGGDSREECLLFCPRTAARVHQEIVRWFGGRVPPGNVIDVGTPYTKKDNLRSGSPKGRRGKKVSFAEGTKDSSNKSKKDIDSTVHRPLATLTSTTKSEIMLVISPLVPPKCFGIVLASCQRRGFQVTGVRRSRLSSKKAAALGIAGKGLQTFCPGSLAAESYDASLAGHVDRQGEGQWEESTFPSTILQLVKENASHSAASLVEDCMVQLTLQGIMGKLQQREGFPLESAHMFHAARFSDTLLTNLGGDFSKCFDPEVQINPSYVVPQLYTNPELEQVTALLLLGHTILKSSGLLLGRLLGMVPYSRQPASLPFPDGLELLGMKWLAGLSTSQAKEVTPYEVGDKLWRNSLHKLANEPVLVLAVRGVDAFRKLESVVPPRPSLLAPGAKCDMEMIHARTAEEAYTYIRQFFTEKELFSDPFARPMLPYIPHFRSRHEVHSTKSNKEEPTYPLEESIFELMQSGPRPFPTFLVIKPRAFHKHFTKILKKLAQEGFKIVGLKLQVLTEGQATRVIPGCVKEADERARHLKHLISGPSLSLCVERENAVKKLLDLLGPEDPQSARRLSQFYWRGVFGGDLVTNGIYASGTYQGALDDLRCFFPEGLCCEESEISQQEIIQCPAYDMDIEIQYSSCRDIIFTHNPDLPHDAPHELLSQTTCIVLTSLLLKKFGAHFGYVDVIEGLVHQGFEFVGGRMAWLTREQAEHLLCVLETGSFQQVPLLLSGPCIILALQRDNAVLAFDSILSQTFSTESCQGRSVTDTILHKYGRLILRPTDIKQASNALRFFFNKLIPDSQAQIVSIKEI
ncbi:dynein axonemal assembly factor 8-like isoform X2 [Mya arenaria]|nr:dynein axonemal assembly factor 8-like isoform X2 [Mya arenaria]